MSSTLYTLVLLYVPLLDAMFTSSHPILWLLLWPPTSYLVSGVSFCSNVRPQWSLPSQCIYCEGNDYSFFCIHNLDKRLISIMDVTKWIYAPLLLTPSLNSDVWTQWLVYICHPHSYIYLSITGFHSVLMISLSFGMFCARFWSVFILGWGRAREESRNKNFGAGLGDMP